MTSQYRSQTAPWKSSFKNTEDHFNNTVCSLVVRLYRLSSSVDGRNTGVRRKSYPLLSSRMPSTLQVSKLSLGVLFWNKRLSWVERCQRTNTFRTIILSLHTIWTFDPSYSYKWKRWALVFTSNHHVCNLKFQPSRGNMFRWSVASEMLYLHRPCLLPNTLVLHFRHVTIRCKETDKYPYL